MAALWILEILHDDRVSRVNLNMTAMIDFGLSGRLPLIDLGLSGSSQARIDLGLSLEVITKAIHILLLPLIDLGLSGRKLLTDLGLLASFVNLIMY